MELDWSEQSPHIRTLYAPWQPGDGYEENVIAAREAEIGAQLPAPLRIFYQAWGCRRDLTQTNQYVLGLAGLVWRPDALVFCVENQGCCWWAIERTVLEEPDPPVVIADPENWNIEDIQAPLIWKPSHAHVSDFLNSLTYQHAFCGGALHGGWGSFQPQESHEAWLEQHWHRIKVRPMALQLADGYDLDLPEYIDIYGRDGQVLHWFPRGCSLATGSMEGLDAIGQAFQVTWSHRW